MKSFVMASAMIVGMAGFAFAQAPPAPEGTVPPPTSPPAPMTQPNPGGPSGPMGGPGAAHRPPPPGGEMGGMMHEMMEHHMHHPESPSKAAHFRFVRGNNMIDVKCADDEPTRACVEATAALMDKLGAMR